MREVKLERIGQIEKGGLLDTDDERARAGAPCPTARDDDGGGLSLV